MFPPFVTELTIRVRSVQTGINERCLVPKYQFARQHAVRVGRVPFVKGFKLESSATYRA